MRIRGLGRLRWPWRAIVFTPAERVPLVMLNRDRGQVIGIALRLPDETVVDGLVYKQLSVLWARPDVTQYPPGWGSKPRRPTRRGD